MTTTSPDLLVGPHERAEHLGVPYCARCGTGQVWPCPWSSTLKALTLHQPYATFVVAGSKRIETRSWRTAYRGWLAVHAGATIPSYLGLGRRGRREIGDYEVEKDQSGLLLRGDSLSWPYRLPLGAVVAVVELVDCVPIVDEVREDVPAYAWPVPAEPDEHDGRLWVRHTKGTSVPFREDDFGNQLPYGDFSPGRYAWMLGRVIRLTRPMPCAGHQGLWDLRRAGPAVVDAVEKAIEQRAS